MKIDECLDILAGFTTSLFQDFKNYIRTEVDLFEADISLVLDE